MRLSILSLVLVCLSVQSISCADQLANSLSPTSSSSWSTFSGAGPAPMPIISRNCPAFASDGQSSAAMANDDSYDTVWRSGRQPSVTAPCWIAYDLSAKHPGKCVITWANTATYPYLHTVPGMGSAYGLPGDYTVDVNKGHGGAVPTTGWKTIVRVTANSFHSRTHLVDLTGYNWVRLSITPMRSVAN